MKNYRLLLFASVVVFSLLFSSVPLAFAEINQTLASEHHWRARPLHQAGSLATPYIAGGYNVSQIRTAYNLPSTGGAGTTIAIIVAFNYTNVRSDLAMFNTYFNLPPADLEVRSQATQIAYDKDWATETAMDVQWAHAIAPQAKLLLVQAKSDNDDDLLTAVDYARNRSDVVAISMSWGRPEDRTVTGLDYHFTSTYGAVFFAASGDDGSSQVIWPAVSPNVVAVGGTTLSLSQNGAVISETGWSGSGGGLSVYEQRPAYQTSFGLTGTRRSIPDVSYNANPQTGFPVYCNGFWQIFGGTSAGTPQWAAIHALGRSSYNATASNTNLYTAAKSTNYPAFFRDITKGSNGGYSAGTSYDYVTGLGSPLTINFEDAISTTNYVALLPEDNAEHLNSTNQFLVTYTSGGKPATAYAQNGTLTLTTDPNTDITVSGQSSGSTTQEKWVLNSAGNSVTGKNMTLYYYNLFAESVTNGIASGGELPQTLALTYSTAPSTASDQQNLQSIKTQLTQTPQTIWPSAGTTISIPNTINSNPTERWSTSNYTWLVTAPLQTFQQTAYNHQFLLNVTGAQTMAQWYNNGVSTQISLQGVFGRETNNGTGQRVSAYTIDGSNQTQVQPTTGNITIPMLMNSAHQIQVTATKQYQVSLDSSTATILATITQPSANGDTYWYDQGNPVQIVLNSVSNRASGVGERLTAYTVNGAKTNVASRGQVTLNLASLNSPITIAATLVEQYKLDISSGSLESVTPTAISGDPGWYDRGTQVTANYDYVWNQVESQSRLNAVNYTLSDGTAHILPRSGNGTFTVKLTMNKPENIKIGAVTQYFLGISGGYSLLIGIPEPAVPMGNYYNAGSTVSVSTNHIWGLAETRQVLTGYKLNGALTNITKTENGTYTIQITLDKAQNLEFVSETQHKVKFQFKNNDGTVDITPTNYQIATNSLGNASLTENSLWLQEGTQFRIQSVTWQNAEVKPTTQTTFTVSAPLTATITCRVFNTTLTVKDHQGKPVPEAQVTITLANQTTLQTKTDTNGVIELPMIPQGFINATISYKDLTTKTSFDASAQPNVVGVLPQPPTPLLKIIVIIAIVALIVSATAAALVLRNKRRKREHNVSGSKF